MVETPKESGLNYVLHVSRYKQKINLQHKLTVHNNSWNTAGERYELFNKFVESISTALRLQQ
jgi:hypothetical protein